MTYSFKPTLDAGASRTPPLLQDLLTMDAVARPHGCGLHPRLRALLEDQVPPEPEIVPPPTTPGPD